MRLAFITALVLVLAGFAAGQEKKAGKAIMLNAANLPPVAKAKAGDTIVVTVRINPADVDRIREQSSNNNVAVKSAAGVGAMRITVSSAQKGKAKIAWTIDTVDGKKQVQELEVEFE